MGRNGTQVEETLCVKQKRSECRSVVKCLSMQKTKTVEYLIVVSLFFSVSGGSVHAFCYGSHTDIDPDLHRMDELQEAEVKTKAGRRCTGWQ